MSIVHHDCDRAYGFIPVEIPSQWHPPGDRLDSQGFNRWVRQQLARVPDQERWVAGMLISLNEIQFKNSINAGSRLIEMSSPLPPGWTAYILDQVAERLEAQGVTLPSLIVSCDGGVA